MLKVHGQRLVRHRGSRESGRGRHVFLRGRRKSVTNFGGIKFFPEEVEAVLDAHPAVRESRVSGEPHERWGAVAVAEFVARDVARPPTAAVLGQHCRDDSPATRCGRDSAWSRRCRARRAGSCGDEAREGSGLEGWLRSCLRT
jgi:acyl-CoA synthetase (AMP-forming)/AMP-acid ligase II